MKQILRLLKILFSPPTVEYPPYPLLYWEELPEEYWPEGYKPDIARAEGTALISEEAPTESVASCQVQASY